MKALMYTNDTKDQVPNHWLRSVLALPYVAEHATDALAAAKLPSAALQEIGASVPRGAETKVLDFLSERLNAPFVGAEIGTAINPHNTALLTYILFNSQTLYDALCHVQKFTPVTRPRARVNLLENTSHVDLVVDGIGPDLTLDTHLIEFALAALLGAFRTATNQSVLVAQVGFAHLRKHGQAELAGIFGCSVKLETEHSYLRFDKRMLDTPIRDADAHLLGHLTSYGDVLLQSTNTAPVSLAETVQKQLLRGMAHGRPKAADTAERIGLSERTMNRRLLKEGTSFRELVSNTQFKLAQAFLADPYLSLAETSHLCGFSDQSSFTQAYRRWTGRTPAVDRKPLIQGENLQAFADGGISKKNGRLPT
ncbi:AraC family transcriptional regulator [Shimia marina]|uniref:Virulence-regulating protein VirS n=2 Tax=Shimia marina TaxID=321267 RepID=A0A0N7LSE3_9RHOB|nr:AraC family transcriptional regulator [Shimia marina]CUH53380.1 Virulence-regulating protein VirS [Shimia marina]SFD78347.1 AraC-type DNA-binding protein [Shimia marina]